MVVRVSKKKSNEIRRLESLGLSKRQIAKALGVHRRTVDRHLLLKEELAIEGQSVSAKSQPKWTSGVQWDEVKAEYAKGVPGTVLFEELHERGIVPVTYSNFLRQLKARMPPKLPTATMRRHFSPGERAEIDYCDGIDFLDPVTGDIVKTQLFVGCLCYSRYTFAEFTLTQKSEDFLSSHRQMFEYFGGVPQVLAPDNLRSAVTKSHRYDPDINQAYAKLARHYQCAVVPARVRRPKDKAIAERTIQSFQKWFFFKVRRRTFTSLSEMNQCLREALIIFNNKVHRILGKSRNELFEQERLELKPLPDTPYEVQAHKVAVVHPDCHINFDKNYYSVPHNHRGHKVDIWYSHRAVEVYYQGERLAFHKRCRGHGNFITDKAHYPEAHQAYWDTTAKALRSKASRLGPNISKLIHDLLSPPDPLRHMRRCQGILRLADRYDPKSLDRACELAILWSKPQVPFVERLLKHPHLLQEKPIIEAPARGNNPFIRGSNYFLGEMKSD